MKILFICLGNICRSPIAEGIARDLILKQGLDIQVDSAGTSSFHIGEPPHKNSIKISKLNNIDISTQKSRPVNVYSDKEYDYYVVMDESNKANLLVFGFEESKILKLGSFTTSFKKYNEDVPDPYTFKDLEGFKEVFDMIYEGITNLLIFLKKENSK